MAKKLSELVELYANQKLEEYRNSSIEELINRFPSAFLRPSSAEGIKKEYRQEAWFLIMDELSEELLKLAGNGLPIQGQRRIADRLCIPRDKVE